MRCIRHYLATLSNRRLILWCYFTWYAVVLVRYFDPSPRLWLTSLGLSGIVGAALLLSTTTSTRRVRLGFWPTFRLFLTPFCVSSFSALVKGRGFILIFSPRPGELLAGLLACGGLVALVLLLRHGSRTPHDAGQVEYIEV